MKKTVMLAAVAFILAASNDAAAQRKLSATPCCEITAIDLSGVITAHEPTNGRTFKFTVANRALLKAIKVGDKVYADFATGKVGLRPSEPCCTIAADLKSQVGHGAPCCEITKIDPVTGIIVAHEPTNGRVFQFTVANRTLLKGIKVGDRVYADFATGRVAIHAGEPCCTIAKNIK